MNPQPSATLVRSPVISPDLASIEAWLNAAPNRERSGDFADMKLAGLRRVLAVLPTPPRPITIAGTKGKGSTTALLEAALLAAGGSTVAFSSPHVETLDERWRIDGRNASPSALADAAQRVVQAEVIAGQPLTWFERGFAMAVVLAATRPGAWFICEVGLGGRLDCANALDAQLAIVTLLDFDHCAILGHTLEAIAGEKLAISRADAPLVLATQTTIGEAAVQQRLASGQFAHSRLLRPGPPPADLPKLRLLGEHQRHNAATALCAALAVLGSSAPRARLLAGLAAASLPGRCQLLHWGDRRVLVDGAHTAEAMQATVTVAHHELRAGWHAVLGLARDKLAQPIVSVLRARCATLYRCGYASERCRTSDAASWADAPGADTLPWQASIGEALDALPPGDVLISGSFYLAGEALVALRARGVDC